MLSRLLFIISFLFLSSCALFRQQNIQDQKVEDLIRGLQGIGEGRGRLGIDQHQYLFSFDAILRDNSDWILAVVIPLHGEEVMTLPNLKVLKPEHTTEESFETRIEREINGYLRSQKESEVLTREFMQELRSMMRLVLHQQLKLEIHCKDQGELHLCSLGKEEYEVKTDSRQLLIKKNISPDHRIELVGQNLTESIFKRTNILLHSQKHSFNDRPLLSLELFWK